MSVERGHAWAACTNCWLPVELILCATHEALTRVRQVAVLDHWHASPRCRGASIEGHVDPRTTSTAYAAIRASLTALEHPHRRARARLL